MLCPGLPCPRVRLLCSVDGESEGVRPEGAPNKRIIKEYKLRMCYVAAEGRG